VAYHTGAAIADGWQPDVADCLGGQKSSTLAKGLEWLRYSPINGLRLTHVEGFMGEGSLTLDAPTVDTVRFMPPGQTTYSESVEVPYGEERVVPWQSGGGAWNRAIRVKRVLDVNLVGSETVHLRDTFNTVAAGEDFVDESTGYTYAAVALYNGGSAQLTGLSLLIPDQDGMRDWLRFSTETPSGGVIQTIADQFTAPTGASWQYWQTGLTLNAGDWLGLWIRREYDANVSARKPVWIQAYYTSGAAGSLHADLRGLARRGKVSHREFQLFVGQDAEPDFDSAPEDTAATLEELAAGPLAVSHEYYVEALYRNAFGLVAAPQETTRFIIDADGDVVTNPPSGPSDVTLVAQSDGTVLVNARYAKGLDATAVQANKWAIFLTDDGTDPDPDVDVPETEDMADNGILEYTTDAYLDETPVKCIVRTRRDDGVNPVSDSENTTIYSTTATYWWANMPRPHLAIGRAAGVYAPVTEVVTPVQIDEAKGIYWENTGHSVALYVNSVLAWTLYETYWKPEFNLDHGTVSGAGTGTAEVGTWDVGAKELFFNVNGTRQLKVDAVAQTITLNGMDDVEAVHERSAETPVWGCYADTCFQFYHAPTGVWSTKMSLNSSGTLVLGVNVDTA